MSSCVWEKLEISSLSGSSSSSSSKAFLLLELRDFTHGCCGQYFFFSQMDNISS